MMTMTIPRSTSTDTRRGTSAVRIDAFVARFAIVGEDGPVIVAIAVPGKPWNRYGLRQCSTFYIRFPVVSSHSWRVRSNNANLADSLPSDIANDSVSFPRNIREALDDANAASVSADWRAISSGSKHLPWQ